MYEYSITNLEEAKKYFFDCGCSHFHMAREYPEKYAEYRGFSILKNQERLWKKEYINEYCNSIMNSADDSVISNSIFRIADVILSDLMSKDYLELLYSLIISKSNVVDSFTKLLFAEDILRVVEASGDHYPVLSREFNELAIKLSHDVISQPGNLSNSTRSIGYLNYDDTLSEENLIRRAKSVIEDIRLLEQP